MNNAKKICEIKFKYLVKKTRGPDGQPLDRWTDRVCSDILAIKNVFAYKLTRLFFPRNIMQFKHIFYLHLLTQQAAWQKKKKKKTR